MSPCSRSAYRSILLAALLQCGATQLWAAEPAKTPAVPNAPQVKSPAKTTAPNAAANKTTVSPAPIAAPTPTPAAIRQEYQGQFERRDWTAAIASAQKLLDAARLRAKQDPLGLAEALVLLGNAEVGAKNMVGAEEHFAESLKLVEDRVGPTSGRLIEPLRGLGIAMAAQNRHEEAVPLMERALVLWRRNYGLFDTNQQGLLRSLAESEVQIRRIDEGQRHMLYLLSISERNFGRNDPRVVPALCLVGNWYIEAGLIASAREKFRIALDIIEDKLGKNSLGAVEPLRGLASSYVSELILANYGPPQDRDRPSSNPVGIATDPRPTNPRNLSPETERSLTRALKILDANADRSPDVLVETLIQQGDILQLRGLFDQALPYYRRAATLLSTELKAKSTEFDPLSFPAQIYYPVPLLAIRNLNRPPEEVVERFVQAEFTVTAQGSIKDVKVSEQDATQRQIAETVESIRAARYRPKFVNGEPVETLGITHRQVFRQRKEAE